MGLINQPQKNSDIQSSYYTWTQYVSQKGQTPIQLCVVRMRCWQEEHEHELCKVEFKVGDVDAIHFWMRVDELSDLSCMFDMIRDHKFPEDTGDSDT